jgi:hypothetical protein
MFGIQSGQNLTHKNKTTFFGEKKRPNILMIYGMRNA